jgi:regulator of nucleoside diphosphate kinase
VTKRTVYVTEFDLQRLRNLIRSTTLSAGGADSTLDDLRNGLEQATPVKAGDIPPDIVTMNSTVRLRDLLNGREVVTTLVFPHRLSDEPDRISVLSPLGCALFGFRQGDEVEVPFPEGPHRYAIVEVIYQPEASGQSSIDFSF